MTFAQQGDLAWRELLTLYRMRAGLTKAELAKMTKIPRTTLYRIEAGHFEPSAANRALLEETLTEALQAQLAVAS